LNIEELLFPLIVIFNLIVVFIFIKETNDVKNQKIEGLKYYSLSQKQRKNLPVPPFTPYGEEHKTSVTLFGVFWISMFIYFVFFA
jgi:hypothetical protein